MIKTSQITHPIIWKNGEVTNICCFKICRRLTLQLSSWSIYPFLQIQSFQPFGHLNCSVKSQNMWSSTQISGQIDWTNSRSLWVVVSQNIMDKYSKFYIPDINRKWIENIIAKNTPQEKYTKMILYQGTVNVRHDEIFFQIVAYIIWSIVVIQTIQSRKWAELQ